MNSNARRAAGLLIALALLYIWLLSSIPVLAVPGAAIDDGLFVGLGKSIHAGRWLGPYNAYTLIKGPGFPLWLSLNALIGTPLFLSEAMPLLLAILLLWRALLPRVASPWMLTVAFAFCLFNPMTFCAENLRIMREGLYAPLTVLIFALLVVAMSMRRDAGSARRLNAVCIGLVIGFYWCIREEGAWILPTLLAAGLFQLWPGAEARRQPGAMRAFLRIEAGYLAIAVAAALLPVLSIELVNRVRYGVADVVEFKQSEFLSAYGALTRIKQADAKDYVPITSRTLDEAAKLSPALREIRPFIRPEWGAFGCAYYGVSPCDGEIRAGHFLWALREAVDRAGYYKTAVLARDFYARLASELDAACNRRELDCLPPRSTMAPPFRAAFIGRTWTWFWRGVRFVAGLEHLNIQPARSSGEPHEIEEMAAFVNMAAFPAHDPQVTIEGLLVSGGEIPPAISVEESNPRAPLDFQVTVEARAADRFRFELTTNCLEPGCEIVVRAGQSVLQRLSTADLLAAGSAPPGSISIISIRRGDAQRWGYSVVADRARRALRAVAWLGEIYQRLLPGLTALAFVLYLAGLVSALITRTASPLLAFNTLLLILLASRILLLAYMEASSMFSINALYLSPAFPICLLFAGLALVDAVNLPRSWRAWSAARGRPPRPESGRP